MAGSACEKTPWTVPEVGSLLCVACSLFVCHVVAYVLQFGPCMPRRPAHVEEVLSKWKHDVPGTKPRRALLHKLSCYCRWRTGVMLFSSESCPTCCCLVTCCHKVWCFICGWRLSLNESVSYIPLRRTYGPVTLAETSS